MRSGWNLDTILLDEEAKRWRCLMGRNARRDSGHKRMSWS